MKHCKAKFVINKIKNRASKIVKWYYALEFADGNDEGKWGFEMGGTGGQCEHTALDFLWYRVQSFIPELEVEMNFKGAFFKCNADVWGSGIARVATRRATSGCL